MNKYLLPLALAALALPGAAHAELPKDTQAAIAKMGHVNDPKTAGLFTAMHHGIPVGIKVTRDLAFGKDPMQKLDFFTSGQGTGKPILLYVHGGGFTRGDKHRPGEFMYDNVMVWAVQNGMVAAQTNYRLAPQFMYPAANEDIADSIKYIREHARDYGGDPNKIVVWGHSAGASLVGIMVSHPEFLQRSGGSLAAAIITSGGYEFEGKNPYLGDDPAKLKERSSVEGLKKTVEDILTRHGVRYTLEWYVSGEPFYTAPGDLSAAAVEAARAVTGAAPKLSTGGGTSDGRFIAPLGAQVIELGVTNATIHKVNECVRIEEVDLLHRMYRGVLERLLA